MGTILFGCSILACSNPGIASIAIICVAGEQNGPSFGRRHPEESPVEIIADAEGRLLVLRSKGVTGSEQRCGEGAVLWAWRLMLIALSVVVNRGLVNAALLFPCAPSPLLDSAVAPAIFLLVSFLPLSCLVYALMLFLAVIERRSSDKSCLVTDKHYAYLVPNN